MSFPYKTRAEQRLEYLESLTRPLTDDESDDLRRSMHAVYERNRRCAILQRHRAEERKLLKKLEREAQIRSPLA